MRTKRKPTLEDFIYALERSLYERYCVCTSVVTPDSILLAVTNAVSDARQAVGIKPMPEFRSARKAKRSP